ncbi:hypothetical protein [Piscinibacter sp.]|uniref:hypothetical protein n=1 Tax=Piscinibacter sp. TaxID=1903157 RepID=UPI002C6C3F23|nr:hypothetical protein [Albitalea sp.]HUG24323.1 hypothetical protein [Albitalea sp.]
MVTITALESWLTRCCVSTDRGAIMEEFFTASAWPKEGPSWRAGLLSIATQPLHGLEPPDQEKFLLHVVETMKFHTDLRACRASLVAACEPPEAASDAAQEAAERWSNDMRKRIEGIVARAEQLRQSAPAGQPTPDDMSDG